MLQHGKGKKIDMKKIGIITYHSAHNYGSVLQAYATQQVVMELGYNCEIINYRMDAQKKFYQLYRTNEGIKILILDLFQLPIHKQRKLRYKRFENFINEKLLVSNQMNNPQDVIDSFGEYTHLVSGSDQIWNKHSNELEHNSWLYMSPYLLKEASSILISYGSSITNMSIEELKKIIPYLERFNAISMREQESAEKLKQLINKEIVKVIDPTLLLNKEQWIDLLKLKKRTDEKYILYYSLDNGYHKGYQYGIEMEKVLLQLANKYNCHIYMVTPFIYLRHRDKRIRNLPDLGPIEFMNYLYNSFAVITNSYHGTILAINFEKNIFSINDVGPSDMRKKDILEMLGLNERIVTDYRTLINEFDDIEYEKVNLLLDSKRTESISYLRSTLCISEDNKHNYKY